MHFELVVDFAAVGRPVLIALEAAVFDRATQAHDDDASLLPNHFPEVTGRVY